MSSPRIFLLDVEGTVAPIAHIYERMFPFARKHLGNYLRTHSAECADALKHLFAENHAEESFAAPRMESASDLPGAETYLLWLMDEDRKSTALKTLQGKVWRAGFEAGELKGELYPDVPPALERWAREGTVAIYSSGSVEAQQLFFRYSSFGDLTHLITAYFDTHTGAKTEKASYGRIAHALSVEAAQICFYSDVLREVDPAREAGCETRLVVRAGNAAIPDANGHQIIESFDGED